MRTALAVVLALLVAVPAAQAKKPPPLPTGPTIVAAARQGSSVTVAIDSDGTLYQFSWDICGGIVTSTFFVVGNMFGGPPPSPVLAIMPTTRYQVLLENGDIWEWCLDTNGDNVPDGGLKTGNIFTAAGTGARLPDLPPMDFAPPINFAAPSQGDPDGPDNVVLPGIVR